MVTVSNTTFLTNTLHLKASIIWILIS